MLAVVGGDDRPIDLRAQPAERIVERVAHTGHEALGRFEQAGGVDINGDRVLVANARDPAGGDEFVGRVQILRLEIRQLRLRPLNDQVFALARGTASDEERAQRRELRHEIIRVDDIELRHALDRLGRSRRAEGDEQRPVGERSERGAVANQSSDAELGNDAAEAVPGEENLLDPVRRRRGVGESGHRGVLVCTVIEVPGTDTGCYLQPLKAELVSLVGAAVGDHQGLAALELAGVEMCGAGEGPGRLADQDADIRQIDAGAVQAR
ncbi:MAG: hypothetical protein R3D25_09410 [Geminicoccaceae bacterium]